MLDGDPIYVIEPHADDAFLSLGWSIRRWARDGRRVVVVTVYGGEPHRAREARRWARSVGAEWRGLPLRDCGEFAPKREIDPLPQPLLDEEVLAPSALRIWPLGVAHPEHRLVAAAAEPGDLRYVDTPYQLSLHAQVELRQAVVGRTVAWWERPPLKKWEGSRFFESQAVLFEEWTPEKLQCVPEVVLR